MLLNHRRTLSLGNMLKKFQNRVSWDGGLSFECSTSHDIRETVTLVHDVPKGIEDFLWRGRFPLFDLFPFVFNKLHIIAPYYVYYIPHSCFRIFYFKKWKYRGFAVNWRREPKHLKPQLHQLLKKWNGKSKEPFLKLSDTKFCSVVSQTK
jgi:hypothetical protein